MSTYIQPGTYLDRPLAVAVQPDHPKPPQKYTAKGHDSQLNEAQKSREEVRVTLMSGEVLYGVIVRRDRYTITLRPTGDAEDTRSFMVFKHAIEMLTFSGGGAKR